jgi:adenylate kinase
MLRDAVRLQTPLGQQVEAIMASGGLIDDRLITDIVRERLRETDCHNGFLLDGFPRTVPQARALDRLIVGRAPLVILEIACPDEDILRRLASRVVCSSTTAGLPALFVGSSRRTNAAVSRAASSDCAAAGSAIGFSRIALPSASQSSAALA